MIHPRRALTLVEVLVAIALVMALTAASAGFLYDLLHTRRQAIRIAREHLAATVLIERLEGDLATCLVGDRARGAGVRGDEHAISVLTRSVPVRLAERGADDPVVLADLERADYRWSAPGAGADGGVIEAKRTVIGAAADPAPPYAPLGPPVGALRFRYHDGTAWRSTYDSLATGRLPSAVEVAVWFGPVGDPPDAEALALEEDDELLEDLEPATLDDLAAPDDLATPADAADLLEDPANPDRPAPDRLRVIIIPDAEGAEG